MSAYIIVLLTAALPLCNGNLAIYYMEDICSRTVLDVHSGLVETAKALTYSSDVDCSVTFKAPEGKIKYALKLRRFITELSGGTCYDYLTIYDGDSNSSPVLVDKLCGEVTGEPEYNTTGGAVTFHFLSDSTAGDRGFAIFLLAYSTGQCGDSDILCVQKQICIDKESTSCDDYDHCGDGSDEQSCAGNVTRTTKEYLTTVGLAVGLAFAVIGLAIIIVILVKCYKRYKQNQYIRELHEKFRAGRTSKYTGEAVYPVTYHYQTDEYVNKNRAIKEAAKVTLDTKESKNYGPRNSTFAADDEVETESAAASTFDNPAQDVTDENIN